MELLESLLHLVEVPFVVVDSALAFALSPFFREKTVEAVCGESETLVLAARYAGICCLCCFGGPAGPYGLLSRC